MIPRWQLEFPFLQHPNHPFGVVNERACKRMDCIWFQLIKKTWNNRHLKFPVYKNPFRIYSDFWFSHCSALVRTDFWCLRREIVGTKHLLPFKNPSWGFRGMQTGSRCRRLANQETNAQEFIKEIETQEFWIFENSPGINPKTPGRIFEWFLWTSRGPVTWNQ